MMEDLHQEFAMNKFASEWERDATILKALSVEREKVKELNLSVWEQKRCQDGLETSLSAAQEKVATLQEDLDLGITRDANLHYYREQLACAQAKVRELAHQKGALIDKADTYYQKLAAAQATIAEMREAHKNVVREANLRDVLPIAMISHEALALPTNQDALHEALARECERLADAEGVEEGHREWLREEAAAHRARKEGK